MSASRSRGALDIERFLRSLPPVTLVVGKGGVGKTTCAVGLTACFGKRRERTLVLSTDPAGSLGTVLGMELPPGEQREIDELPGCAAMQLDAPVARTLFLSRWREALVTIVDRGTYLDTEDIDGLVDAAFPGADEIFALLTLAELVGDRQQSWDRLIVDTAPTGHTLRLLSLPETFDAMISLLDAMQAKHRFMVSALTHRYRPDAADEFLSSMRALVARLRSSLGDARSAAAVLVTRAESIVVDETRRYASALEALHVAVAAIVVQAFANPPSPEEALALRELEKLTPPLLALSRHDPAPTGAKAIGRLMEGLREVPRLQKPIRRERKRLRGNETAALSSLSGGPPSAALSLLRTLTIVGGKGGVGKTTVACALALAAASDRDYSGRVLLVSTDPAPSIGDAVGIPDPRWARRSPAPVPNAPRLDAWQMDATTAFEELRDRYRDRIDAIFDAVVGRGVDVAHDRGILRDLLALTPPGIDELYALSALGELLADERYGKLIVDPAPTGHLLRLLEMPAVALDWSHRLMRLMLKYRDVVGLGDAAQELLSFSRRTRGFEQLLHDGRRAGVVLVTLDEPVVAAESARLSAAMRATGIAVHGVVFNRLRHRAKSAFGAVIHHVPTITAPESDRPLVGAAAIADWCWAWRARD